MFHIQITKRPPEDRHTERKPDDHEGQRQRDAAASQGRSKVIRKLIKGKTRKGSSRENLDLPTP